MPAQLNYFLMYLIEEASSKQEEGKGKGHGGQERWSTPIAVKDSGACLGTDEQSPVQSAP